VAELAHVLGAVDDGELAARVDEAGIAGLEPAVRRHGIAGGLLLLVVAEEHAGALHLHLAALTDAHLRARQAAADRVRIGLLVALQADERARLGGTVDLLQVDAEGAEEAERVGAERRTTREAPQRVAKPQLIAHRAIDEI